MSEDIISVDDMLLSFFGEDLIAPPLRPRLQHFLNRDFLNVTPELVAADLSQAIKIFSKEMITVIRRLAELYDDHADVTNNPIRAAFPDENKIREAAGGRVINHYKVDHRRPFAMCDWRWLYETIMAHTDTNEAAFYLFMALTGFRRVDASLLHPSHFFPEDGSIRKKFSKSKTHAHIPLGRVARGIVERRIATAPPGEPTIVFVTRHFTSVPPNTAFFKQKLAGRPDVEFSTLLLREAWKNVALSLGLDQYMISQISGDNVPILCDPVAFEQRRIWMQAVEDRILELATSESAGQKRPEAA